MLRFIFACMAIVALTVISIPVQSVFKGIENQRATLVAQQEAEDAAQLANNETAEDPFAAFDVAAEEPSADDLNAIETAAGGFDDTIEDTGFGTGFSGTAPAALRGPVNTTPVDETPEN